MIEWTKNKENGDLKGSIETLPWPGARGRYTIWIQKRPYYCDRGDWMIYIDTEGDTNLDDADGFPRYFFGSEDDAKEQMETWAGRRTGIKAYREANHGVEVGLSS